MDFCWCNMLHRAWYQIHCPFLFYLWDTLHCSTVNFFAGIHFTVLLWISPQAYIWKLGTCDVTIFDQQRVWSPVALSPFDWFEIYSQSNMRCRIQWIKKKGAISRRLAANSHPVSPGVPCLPEIFELAGANLPCCLGGWTELVPLSQTAFYIPAIHSLIIIIDHFYRVLFSN